MHKFDIIIFTCLMFLSTLVYSQKKAVRIIPQPADLTLTDDHFQIGDTLVIFANDIGLFKLIEYTSDNLSKDMGIATEVKVSLDGKNVIQLILDSQFENKKQGAYHLEVGSEGIKIVSATEQGLFYGVQSFRQLTLWKDDSGNIPGVIIRDAPRFGWRAFMFDEGRYFQGKEQVKKLLDEMARLKMNVFHWHLVDDQGWRIEIKKYPLLTEIGSKRPSTQVGPLQWNSPIQSGEPHEGFYTQNDILEIVEYATERHITIVPEIEMPGHSTAAIAAYSWLGSSGKDIDVPIVFGVGKDVYNVADPKVYNFLTDVLDEVMALFPSKVIHIGGDEVKYEHWKNSEYAQKYMKEQGLETPVDLQIFFTNRISKYLESKGRRMMGWNEIMGHQIHEYQTKEDSKGKEELAKSTVVHFWRGDMELFMATAEGGFDIVNSLHSSTYLDYSYEDIPIKKAYEFDPIPKDLEQKFHKNVLGTGCQMWGEWIPTSGYMDYQVFPRIVAYAEVGWTPKNQKDFNGFMESLPKLMDLWKQNNIYYAPFKYAQPAKEKKEQ